MRARVFFLTLAIGPLPILGPCAGPSGSAVPEAELGMVLARLARVAGEVKVHRTRAGTGWGGGAEGDSLRSRDYVRTGGSGEAVLSLAAGGEVRMSANSFVIVKQSGAGADSSTLEVQGGSLAAKLADGDRGGVTIRTGTSEIRIKHREVSVIPSPASSVGAAAAGENGSGGAAIALDYVRALVVTFTTSPEPEAVAEARARIADAERAWGEGRLDAVRQAAHAAWEALRNVDRKTAAPPAELAIDVGVGGQDRVQVFSGSVAVETGTQSMTVREGEGVSVAASAAQAAVRPLPQSPRPVGPAEGDEIFNVSAERPLILAWSGEVEGATYEVQLAADADFARPIASSLGIGETRSEIQSAPVGEAWWRVRARDPEGFLSKYSPAIRITLKEDHTPPDLEIDTPEWK